jgi:hypothetical protein
MTKETEMNKYRCPKCGQAPTEWNGEIAIQDGREVYRFTCSCGDLAQWVTKFRSPLARNLRPLVVAGLLLLAPILTGCGTGAATTLRCPQQPSLSRSVVEVGRAMPALPCGR